MKKVSDSSLKIRFREKLFFTAPENENVFLNYQNLQLEQEKGTDCFMWSSTFKTEGSLGLHC